MSFCKEEGKDKVIFVTKEDHNKPSSTKLDDYYEGEPENGDINWNCPCLGGMATGPCGYEFRAAFTCFHNSTTEPKGSDCYEEFKGMQDCMIKHPTVYDTADKDDEEVDVFGAGTEEEEEASAEDSKSESSASNANNSNDNEKANSNSKQGR